MGKKAIAARRTMRRSIRAARLSPEERAFLLANSRYEGSPFHKRSPGDFGLIPPAAPRPDKTLCDVAAVTRRALAEAIFRSAIDGGIVSEGEGAPRYPKQIWAVTEAGYVFEAMYGGSRTGAYHGYPIPRDDPFFERVRREWGRRGA